MQTCLRYSIRMEMMNTFTISTKASRKTELIKSFSIVRNFLEKYMKDAKRDEVHRPSFADSPIAVWCGLSQSERDKVIELSRSEDYSSLECMLREIDDLEKENSL